ncbi:MAG TPA: group II intron reverse transcriptase/maturase [Terriglobales bacterium]|nr:group II intron reverse transcriptase/maturase [Terriglobales bacterium]
MYETLMEQVVSRENATEAWLAVKRNGGAAGIDRMTTEQLRDHIRAHWENIQAKLLAGTYVPSPVRRVEIPKPNGGTRMLGIPTVQDRWIQQMLLQVLQPIFDPTFSEHSYGFRPQRGAQDAVRAAQKYVKEGRDWVVDMDISKFFDRVNHDILMNRIGQRIRDKRVLRLIGGYLRAGVMTEGVVVSSEEGTPQGGPLSPLLANIYLNALDRELEQRGLAFSRYADDCNIYVGSRRAAERVLESITRWIAKELRLEVNASKSGVGHPWERKFLGFRINRQGLIEASPQSVERMKDKVRKFWRSCQSLSSAELRDRWRAYIQGWWAYYGLAEERRNIFATESWIRRHIRCCFWQRWHDSRGRLRHLRALGVHGRILRMARSSKGAWSMALNGLMNKGLGNAVLRHHGFLVPSDLAVGA